MNLRRADRAPHRDPALNLAARCVQHHRALSREERIARAAEQRLAQVARANRLSLTRAIRRGHVDARLLRRAQRQVRRQRRRRDILAAKLSATRATTSAGARAKLLLALAAFDLDGIAASLVRSAAADLRATKIAPGDAR